MGRRIRWLGLVMLLCFGAVLVQLTNVQFRKASALANSPTNPKVIQASFDRARGQILADDGTVLAQSVPAPRGSTYKWQRQYPGGPLFSQVVGFDSYNYGKVGVEETYNNYLISHKQPARSLEQLLTPTSSTDNVTLTLRPQLQAAAQQALANRDGAIVALDPSTGAIEALYSNPTFDQNPLASNSAATEAAAWQAGNVSDPEGFAPLSNIAVTRTFPPGSTFKVITASAAYDHAPQLVNKLYPPEMCIQFPDSPVPLCNYGNGVCPGAPGGNISVMLPPSCDTGFAQLGTDVGGQGMYEEATSFGYDSAPPVDFTAVGQIASSNFPKADTLGPGTSLGIAGLGQSSIGQRDVAATALQGSLEAAAIANQGTIMKPHVMAEVHDAQGDVVTSYQPSVWRHATNSQTAAALSGLMQQVVSNPVGTAAGVGFPPQDQVAVKTGTAQSGATAQFTTDWMVAFAPASSPKIAVAVVLPQQVPTSTGAECAGPVMNDMIQAALGTPNTQLPPPEAGCPTP